MNTGKDQSYYEHNRAVTAYLAVYIFVVYFQGAYQALVNSKMYIDSDVIRNPDLPLWLKMTDEVMLIFGLGAFLLTRFKIKDLFYSSFAFVLTTTTLVVLGLRFYFYDGQIDLLGLSVFKTLFFISILIYLILGGLLNGALTFRFIHYLHRILLITLVVGLVLYFLYPYKIYGNRLIGLSLNPNFNGLHSLFLVMLFYSNRLSKSEELLSGVVAIAGLFYSCSITAGVMFVLQVTVFGLFSLFFNRTYFKTYLKKTAKLVVSFLLTTLFAYCFSPNVIFYDYANKYYGLMNVLDLGDGTKAFEDMMQKSDLPNMDGRIESAKMVYGDVTFMYEPRKSEYVQTDSSWMNLIYNFGVGGFVLFFGSIFFFFFKLYKRAGLRKFSAAIHDPLFSMMLIFSLNFLIVGCFIQQYLENWNTSLLFVAAIGYMYWRTSSLEVSVD